MSSSRRQAARARPSAKRTSARGARTPAGPAPAPPSNALVARGLTSTASAGAAAGSATLLTGGAAGAAIRDSRDARTTSFWEALGVGPEAERNRALEQLTAFRITPFAPLQDFDVLCGRFDVAVDLLSGRMWVTVKVAYDFVRGDPAAVGRGFRASELRWQPSETERWRRSFQNTIAGAWSGQVRMRSTHKHWDKLVVDTSVEVVETDSDPHFTVVVAKHPRDADLAVSAVGAPRAPGDPARPPGDPAAAATKAPGRAMLDSNDLRPEAKLDGGEPTSQIPFAGRSPALSSMARDMVDLFIPDLKGKPRAHVVLTGYARARRKKRRRAAARAIASMDLARARTAAVRARLIAGGVQDVQILVRNAGESDSGTPQRVDIQVGTRALQIPVLHEGGHMLGYKDEYPDPDEGAPAGSPVDAGYATLIRDEAGEVVVRGATAGVMSMGSTVQRWNYSAFLRALKKITQRSDWSID